MNLNNYGDDLQSLMGQGLAKYLQVIIFCHLLHSLTFAEAKLTHFYGLEEPVASALETTRASCAPPLATPLRDRA